MDRKCSLGLSEGKKPMWIRNSSYGVVAMSYMGAYGIITILCTKRPSSEIFEIPIDLAHIHT
jgi:hypothetical protein